MIDDEDANEPMRQQTAVWIPPDVSGRSIFPNPRDNYTRQLYCHMLMEDIGNRVIPYSLNNEAEEEMVSLTTDDRKNPQGSRRVVESPSFSSEI